MTAQPSPVSLSPEQRSGTTMLRPAEQPAHKAGLPFTRISRAEFDAAPGRSRTPDMCQLPRSKERSLSLHREGGRR